MSTPEPPRYNPYEARSLFKRVRSIFGEPPEGSDASPRLPETESVLREAESSQNLFKGAGDFSEAKVSNREPPEWTSTREGTKDTGDGQHSLGSALNLSRETPDGALRLDFQEYALAIARVLRDARGEFCMALLGRWGAGKTRLARLTENYVKSPQLFTKEINDSALPRAESDSLRYSTVWFSAWQYRRVPEAWIYLYETFSKALVQSEALPLRIARVLRVNVARRGEGDLIFRFCALAVVLAPLSLLESVARLLLPLIGLLGIYQVITFMRRGPKAVKQIAADYASVARHGEKLGLQASIGSDLRALLRGWIMRPVVSRDALDSGDISPLQPRLMLWGVPTLVGLLWAIALLPGLPILGPPWLHALPGMNDVATGVGSLMSWMVVALWCVLVAASAVLLVWPADPTDRLLLIVDDLDRCLPGEAIEILEALKLLLEDPAVAARVQVLVLVDEAPLGVAIREKYKSLIEARLSDGGTTIREHMEKLFLCSLRLPELSIKDVTDLVEIYTRPSPPHLSTPIPPQPDGKAKPLVRTELFAALEQEVLSAEAGRAVQAPDTPPTPRQIRAFLTKYQLARALCHRSVNQDPDLVRRLAAGLAKAIFNNVLPPASEDRVAGESSVDRVIREVV